MYLLKNVILRPKIVFFILVLLFSLILFPSCHFNIPDFWVNKENAFSILNNGAEYSNVFKLYGNPHYFSLTFCLHGFTISIILLFISTILSFKNWEDFMNNKIFQNKYLVIVLTNILYPLWFKLELILLGLDLNKHIYNSLNDTTFIGIMGAYALLFVIGIIYYLVINVLNFIIYFTKFSSKYVINFLKLVVIIFCLLIIQGMCCQFSWLYVYLYSINTLWLLIIAGYIKFLQLKLVR